MCYITVKFFLIMYKVCEIFDGYSVNSFHLFVIDTENMGICRFLRNSMLLVCIMYIVLLNSAAITVRSQTFQPCALILFL